MSWDQVKNDKEGYIKVRKGDTKALHGRTKKANDDSKAQGYIELKVDDLGFEGGGGPHTHTEYANKEHDHDEYLTDLPDHDHPEYEGGAEYDDQEVRDLIQGNTDSIAEIQTKGYDDTELRGLVDGKAEEDHTHDEYLTDLTHDHDEDYADKTSTNTILNAMAQDISSLETKTYNNQEAIKEKSDTDHNHDAEYVHEHPYAADDHTHPPQDLTHDHNDQYFAKGGESDDDGNPLPLPYPDGYTLGTALDEHGHEFPDPVYMGDEEPEKPEEGDLWYNTDRLEMFIRYQDGWVTTTALGARIEQGEAIQRDLLDRVAAGEAAQVVLQEAVEGKTDKSTNDQILHAMGQDISSLETKAYNNQEAIKTKADADHDHDPPDLTHNHNSQYLSLGGEQLGNDHNWKLRMLNNNDGRNTYIDIKDNKLHLYHVADPANPEHATSWGYIDERKADTDHEHEPAPLGRPFVYGNSDLSGHFVTASSSTSIYFNKTDANGQTRRHRHAPDFQWDGSLRYTIWDENGVLVHAGLTGLSTDYADDKLKFKQCRPLYDMGLVDGTTYYINLEGYW